MQTMMSLNSRVVTLNKSQMPVKRSTATRQPSRVVIVRSGDGTPEGETPPPKKQGGSAYADELPDIPRTELSDAMKEKMRREYYGLGGSPNKPMSGNYFLYIILIIAFLAVLSAALGYI